MKVDRYFAFCPLAFVAQVDNFLLNKGNDSGNGETFTNGVPLKPISGGAVSHMGQDWYLTSASLKDILKIHANNLPPKTVYWEKDGWTWETALADAGLVVDVPD